MSAEGDCLFCRIKEESIRYQNDTFLVIRDSYPVSPGHSLIIPKRHIPSCFGLTAEEMVALNDAMGGARADIETELNPDGYNMGINDGRAAGQTVMHLHVHLIPRYKGDREEPRGGIRWIFPETAKYWED